MRLKIFTFSFMLLFATCSFAHAVHTANEPHKQMAAVFEILNKKDEDDEDE